MYPQLGTHLLLVVLRFLHEIQAPLFLCSKLETKLLEFGMKIKMKQTNKQKHLKLRSIARDQESKPLLHGWLFSFDSYLCPPPPLPCPVNFIQATWKPESLCVH